MCGCLPTFPRFLAHIRSKIPPYLPIRKAPPSVQHPESALKKMARILITRTTVASGGGDVEDCVELNDRSSDVTIQHNFSNSTIFGDGSIAGPKSASSSIAAHG